MTGVMSDRWPRVSLRDVTIDVKSWNPSAADEFTYVDISSIDNDLCEIVDAKRIPGAEAPSRARRPIRKGDVLFANVRTYLRNVALVPELTAPAVASTGFTLLRPKPELDPRYLYHLARSDLFINKVTPEQTGTHYPATSDRVVRDQEVPLPPLREQRAIVERIDGAESVRRSGATHLTAARQAIGRVRQTVLSAACSGRLTVDWRSGRGLTDAEDGMPTGWELQTLESLAEDGVPVTYGIVKPGPEVPDGVPYVRQQDIDDGTVLVEQLAHTSVEIAERYRRTSLCEGDVLLCIIRNLRVAVVPAGIDGANITQGMVRIRPGLGVDGAYLAMYLESPAAQRWMHDRYVGLAMPRINVRDARAIPVPLPPVEEQALIVERATSMLALATDVTLRLDAAERRVNGAAQAVLFKALRGELTAA